MNRTLYVVPLLHDETEILREGLPAFKKLPKDITDTYFEFVRAYWNRVEPRLSQHQVNRVYLDGYTGMPIEMIAAHAERGSKVSKAVMDIVSRGANLELTEEAPLIEVMRIVQKAYLRGQISSQQYDREFMATIMSRDYFIRRNIRATLKDGEKGMLFLGSSHIIPPYGDVTLEEVYPRQLLKQELLQHAGDAGRIIVEEIDMFERIHKTAIETGVAQQLEDYVEHPEKYGFDYKV